MPGIDLLSQTDLAAQVLPKSSGPQTAGRSSGASPFDGVLASSLQGTPAAAPVDPPAARTSLASRNESQSSPQTSKPLPKQIREVAENKAPPSLARDTSQSAGPSAPSDETEHLPAASAANAQDPHEDRPDEEQTDASSSVTLATPVAFVPEINLPSLVAANTATSGAPLPSAVQEQVPTVSASPLEPSKETTGASKPRGIPSAASGTDQCLAASGLPLTLDRQTEAIEVPTPGEARQDPAHDAIPEHHADSATDRRIAASPGSVETAALPQSSADAPAAQAALTIETTTAFSADAKAAVPAAQIAIANATTAALDTARSAETPATQTAVTTTTALSAEPSSEPPTAQAAVPDETTTTLSTEPDASSTTQKVNQVEVLSRGPRLQTLAPPASLSKSLTQPGPAVAIVPLPLGAPSPGDATATTTTDATAPVNTLTFAGSEVVENHPAPHQTAPQAVSDPAAAARSAVSNFIGPQSFVVPGSTAVPLDSSKPAVEAALPDQLTGDATSVVSSALESESSRQQTFDAGQSAGQVPAAQGVEQRTQATPVAFREVDTARVDQSQLYDHVAQGIQFSHQNGQEVRIRLNPPELGSLQIDVSVKNGTLSARIETQVSATRQILNEHLPQLQEALAQHGLTVDRIDVSLADRPFDSHHGTSGRSFAQDQQPQQNSSHGQDRRQAGEEASPPAALPRPAAGARGHHLKQLDIKV